MGVGGSKAPRNTHSAGETLCKMALAPTLKEKQEPWGTWKGDRANSRHTEGAKNQKVMSPLWGQEALSCG